MVSVGPPSLYLEKNFIQLQLPNVVVAWSSSTSQYIQEGVKNLEKNLVNQGMKLMKGEATPFSP